MPGASNFLRFDENNTNIMNDADYLASPQRQGGVGNGIADPALHNKLFMQLSMMASALADSLASKGYIVTDTDYSGLVAVLNNIALTADYPKSIDDLTDVIISSPLNKQLLTYNTADSKWENKTPVFSSLTDVPQSYTGQSGKALRVKSTVDGLEFYTAGDMAKSIYDTVGDGDAVNKARTLVAGSNLIGAINENLVTLPSSSTFNIGSANGNYIIVTGTTTITAFDTVQPGTRRYLRFSGSLTVTHNATNLILPGGVNINVVAGDVMVFVSGGGGIWRCVSFQPNGYTLKTLWEQADVATLFIPAGITYSPITYAGRNRTYNKITVNCQGENPTSLVLTLYHNGSVIYTSPAITTNETTATVNLAITADQTIYALVSNTTGLTKGISVSLKQVNR